MWGACYDEGMGIFRKLKRFLTGADTVLGWAERLSPLGIGVLTGAVGWLRGLDPLIWFVLGLVVLVVGYNYFYSKSLMPLRMKRRNWIPSSKCIKKLKQLKPNGGKVVIQVHDTPSHHLAKSLQDAFKIAGWDVDYSEGDTWHDSPLFMEGIQIKGGSHHTISGAAKALEKDGLPGIKQNPQPEYFKERWGTIELKLAILSE